MGKLQKNLNYHLDMLVKYVVKIKLPLAIPCHRVVRSDGSMGGFSSRGGLFLKKNY